jgi:predicted dinucleotide-binding enzyme
MKIAVIGTGMVGRAVAGRLASLGHDVVIGTRNVERTLGRTDPEHTGASPYAEWHRNNLDVRLVPFADAGSHGEIIVNATNGAVSLQALAAVGADNLAGKVLIDIALPLDRSETPPMLLVANTDSLGEQIQRAFPQARVVKTLHTVLADIMVDPARLPGNHNIFLAGEDEAAKNMTKELLREFGWRDEVIIDLGGIKGARRSEMYMPLFFALTSALGTYEFNIAIVKG